jgi:rhomboid protease GluP
MVQPHNKVTHPTQEANSPSLFLEPLRGPSAWMSVTSALIIANVLVAVAMLVFGAGLWHSSNSVQMAWGANFGPATKDGEWWRLGTAMFLHFGALHLGMNMFALWDSGRLVERAFGPGRFAIIYFASGLTGNLLSLIVQGDRAISGGASGAVFGVYGAFLVFLLAERRRLHPSDFKLMFWGAAIFSAVALALGLLIPGIDNAAHLGGLIAGAMSGIIVAPRSTSSDPLRRHAPAVVAGAYVLAVALLVLNIPQPAYRWSEEKVAREEIREFLGADARINARLRSILEDQPSSGASFDQLAGRVETEVVDSYEQSFDQLSSLRISPGAPSAATLERLRNYAEARRDASQELAEGLREQDAKRIRDALEGARHASQGLKNQPAPTDRPIR